MKIPIEVPEGYFVSMWDNRVPIFARWKPYDLMEIELPHKIGDKICDVCDGSGKLDICSQPCKKICECPSCKTVTKIEVVEDECEVCLGRGEWSKTEEGLKICPSCKGKGKRWYFLIEGV